MLKQTEIIDALDEAQIQHFWANQVMSDVHFDAKDHLVYLIARSLNYMHKPHAIPHQLARLKKAFGPVSNNNELLNGRKPYDTLENLLSNWIFVKSTNLPLKEETYYEVLKVANLLLLELRRYGR